MTLGKSLQIVYCIAVLFVSIGYCTICHNCDGQACLRTTQVNTTKTCTATDDPCIAIFTGFVPIRKGCYSDLTDAQKLKCDATDDISCYKCTTDRCNNLGRTDHKCKSCVTTSVNGTCLDSPQSLADIRCPAPRTVDVYCGITISGNVTSRSCITTNREIQDCLNHPQTCSMCGVSTLGACNAYEFPSGRRKCWSCASTSCSAVNGDTTDVADKFCLNVDDRCVTINHNGVYKRKCEMEMTVEETSYCAQHNTSCPVCVGDNCNTATPPNDGNTLVATVTLNIGLLLVVMLLK